MVISLEREGETRLLLFGLGGDMMVGMQDAELLRAYAIDGSEAAFAELTKRYVDLVHSAVRRQLSDHQLAEETTQTVFLLLARRSFTLLTHPSLPGWLYRTACHLAAKARRTEERRRRREQEAAQMNAPDANAPVWREIEPLLDEALHDLGERDRRAILLRFFLRKPMHDVGAALGTTEAAAKMRVGRALERLRDWFTQRGVACSSVVLGALLLDRAVSATPSDVVARIAAAATATGRLGPALSSLAKLLIVMNKFKTVSLLFAGLLLLVWFSTGLRHSAPPDTAGTNSVALGGRPSVKDASDGLTPRVLSFVPAKPPLSEAELENARRELRAALLVPLPKSGVSWPESKVIDALGLFGNRRDAAFEVLKAAVRDPATLGDLTGLRVGDPALMVRDRARAAMAELGKDVPGLMDFLWKAALANENGEGVTALFSLKRLGLVAKDLPALTAMLADPGQDSPAMRRYLPLTIAEVYAKEPEAAATWLPGLVSLLNDADPKVRFGAACALIRTPAGPDPRIMELIGAGLKGKDTTDCLLAAETLAAVGDRAKPLVPALLDYAKSTPDQNLRSEALRAVGRIQPELRTEMPELDQVMRKDAQSAQLTEKFETGSAGLEDMVKGMEDPRLALNSASRLGDLGPAAASAVPNLLKVLWGKNEDDREQIVQAIHKVDPTVKIERVSSEAVMNGVIAAVSELDGKPEAQQSPELQQLLLEHRKYSTWYTRSELIDLARQLAVRDPDVYRAFVKAIIEKDPALADSLQPKTAKP